MTISCDIICLWRFIAILDKNGEDEFLEPEISFIGNSYEADNEIDKRIERFEIKTGLKVLGVCLRGFRVL